MGLGHFCNSELYKSVILLSLLPERQRNFPGMQLSGATHILSGHARPLKPKCQTYQRVVTVYHTMSTLEPPCAKSSSRRTLSLPSTLCIFLHKCFQLGKIPGYLYQIQVAQIQKVYCSHSYL